MNAARQRALQRGVDLLLVGSVIVLLAMAASMWAANPVSFDGGINLQVARNLADGRRLHPRLSGYSTFSDRG